MHPLLNKSDYIEITVDSHTLNTHDTDKDEVYTVGRKDWRWNDGREYWNIDYYCPSNVRHLVEFRGNKAVLYIKR